MGIRGKLLLLVTGIGVPLVLVGVLDLRSMWELSRSQLDDSVKQQVDLAAVAFERWLVDQKKALDAIAALAGDNDTSSPAVRKNLESVLSTRPSWLDLRITNTAGTTVTSQPPRQEFLPQALTDYLESEMRERNSWVVVTDRTVDEAHPIVIMAVPMEKGGAVIARIDGAAINALFNSLDLSQQVVISVVDSEGRVLYRRRGSEAHSEPDVSWSPLSSVLKPEDTNVVELTSPIDGIKRVYGVTPVKETGLVVMIGIPSSTLYEPARARLVRYALIGAGALILAIGAALVIERSIVIPVRRLRSAAQLFGAGDLSARAELSGSGEIGDLGATFNRMANQIVEREGRLQELDRLRSDFVSSVSHELKTPLTTIKLLAHLLQRTELDESEKLEHSKSIAVECDRQIDFVGNLLDLSRIESGAYKLRKSRVDIDELFGPWLEVEQYRASSLGLELTIDIERDLTAIRGDAEALRRVLRGMVDNAIKYTAEGGKISVTAIQKQNTIAICVKDTGKGISPNQLDRVFEKFYRADSDETENGTEMPAGTAAGGVGLGLYLAQHVVKQLSGEIAVESEPGRGSTFTLLLPQWTDSPFTKLTTEENKDVEKAVSS